MNPTLVRLAATALLAAAPALAGAQASGSFDCIARAATPCAPGALLAPAAGGVADAVPVMDLQRVTSFESARGGGDLALSTGAAPALLAAPPAGVVGPSESALPSAVPEPSAYVLMLAGLAVLGFMARRRRN